MSAGIPGRAPPLAVMRDPMARRIGGFPQKRLRGFDAARKAAFVLSSFPTCT
jgi:hypothetical protein